MSPEQTAASTPFEAGAGGLRPEDVVRHELPLSLRGYDRAQVDNYLRRVSEAYLLTWRHGVALRERLVSLEEELAQAQTESQASSKSVAELVQRCATAEDQLAETEKLRRSLEAKFAVAEADRKQAVHQLRDVSEKASDLENRLQGYAKGKQDRDLNSDAQQSAAAEGEAAGLLVAAARAADDVRDASRARALLTLTNARRRAQQLHAETERGQAALEEMQARRDQAENEANELLATAHAEAERERAALAEMEARREQAENEANELLATAHAEAERERAALAEMEARREQAEQQAAELLASARVEVDRAAVAAEEERRRVRELLAGTLASLDAEGAGPSADEGPDDHVTDISARRGGATEAHVA